jgi:two-component system nitrogen regulation response regulator GlnG
VRQLENTCRWITVMAPGREIHLEDLPPELKSVEPLPTETGDWETALARWADEELSRPSERRTPLLDTAVPKFERIMIETALKHTGGRRRDASILLGWGRNTLTRKIQELGMDAPGTDD